MDKLDNGRGGESGRDSCGGAGEAGLDATLVYDWGGLLGGEGCLSSRETEIMVGSSSSPVNVRVIASTSSKGGPSREGPTGVKGGGGML